MKILLLHPEDGHTLAVHPLEDLDLCKSLARELGVEVVITSTPS